MSLSNADISPTAGIFDPTGVPQLDRVIGGGLRRGTLAIIMGPPGSGKTTLASQIAFASATRGQKALLLTVLSESTTKLLGHLQTYSFFAPELIGDAIQVFSLNQFLPSMKQENLTGQEIVAAVRQTRASIVVLDGFQGIRGGETAFAATRQLLYELGMRLSLMGTTTLITTEADPRDPTLFPEMTTGDVLIGLYYTLSGMRSFRSLEAIKVRGGAPLPGRHSIRLSEQGMEVFPRLETGVRHVNTLKGLKGIDAKSAPMPLERASFGLEELDRLLGGGIPYQTATLLAGSLGTGKTLLGLQFALAGVNKGEPTLFLGFRETIEQLLRKADDFALGQQLRQALASEGLLTLQRWDPVELDPDWVATDLFALLEKTGARRLVIDSILELERAVCENADSERVPNYLSALLARLREREVTVLALKEIRKSLASHPDFSVDSLAVLAENVVLLQQMAYRGKMHRVLSVLKMRFSAHDYAFREFQIAPPQGIHVLSTNESEQDFQEGLMSIYEKWDTGEFPRADKGHSSER